MTDRLDRIRVGDRVTIYPRGKRRLWCADFWRDGRHCRQSLGTANKNLALQKALKLEAELVAGTYQVAPPPTTFSQAADDYLEHLLTEDRAKSTRVKYRGILKNLIAFLVGRGVTRLSQFAATDFDKFRTQRKLKDRHCTTLYTEGVIIKGFLKWATSRRLVAANPLADFKLDKPHLEPREGPSLAQIDLVLRTLPEPLPTIVAVLAFTGMRSSELKRLQPEDVDLDGNWIHVRSRPGGETKTRQSRKVPIHPRLRLLLMGLLRRQRPWFFLAPPSRKYPAGGRPLNVKKLNEKFKRVLKTLGLPAGQKGGGYTLHSLRHSFETILVNAGIAQRAIDSWLGHRGDRSMAAVYYRLRDEDSQAFMLKVPFGSATPAADAGIKKE